jgi:hypothetical protein
MPVRRKTIQTPGRREMACWACRRLETQDQDFLVNASVENPEASTSSGNSRGIDGVVWLYC